MARGFTLLELMVVVTIAVVIATLAVPGMQTLSASLRRDAQLNRVMRDFMYARNQAVNLGVVVRVCSLNDSDTCDGITNDGYTIFIDSDSDSVLDDDEITLARYSDFESSSSVELTRTSVMFSPDGLSAGAQATFRYCASQSEYAGTVSTSQLGSVTSKSLNVCPID
jgi:prepilin-type N-terminal cleavage/methylation domain-containing protein